ncbi:hypothetical protein GCM10029978_108340 [Actinoallomurus acanthiterrae]
MPKPSYALPSRRVLRSALLAVVVTLVVLQAYVGSEATRLGTRIFHSQTCDEPGALFDLPDGVLRP